MELKSIRAEGDNITLSIKELKECFDRDMEMQSNVMRQGDVDVALYYLGRANAITEIINSATDND